jgi:hypothetical protein
MQAAVELISQHPRFSLLGKVAAFVLARPLTRFFTQGVVFTMDLFNSPYSVKQDSNGNAVAGSHRPEEFAMAPGLWMEFRHHFYEGEEYDYNGYAGQIRRELAVKRAQQWYGVFTLICRPPRPA